MKMVKQEKKEFINSNASVKSHPQKKTRGNKA